MKKTILITAATYLAASATLLAGPAQEIAAKHASASAKELEAYMTKNPEAEDKTDAINLLLQAYGSLGNEKRVAELYQIRFDAIEGGPETNAQQLYVSTQALLESRLDASDKEGAKKVFSDGLKKIEGNKSAAELAKVFAQMKTSLNRPVLGETMDIKIKSLEGEEIDLATMKDKVVLVDFWATWCKPCIGEIPHVQKTYAKYREQGFEVVAISTDRDEKKLKKFLEENELPWLQAHDKGSVVFKGFGLSRLPSTFLIGKDGTVVATNLRGDALEKEVAKQLGGE